MLVWIDRRYIDELLKPGTTAFVCWRNYGRNTNAGNGYHENYWVGVICSETTIPASLRQNRPSGWITSVSWKEEPKTAGGEEYSVFLPEKGKL